MRVAVIVIGAIAACLGLLGLAGGFVYPDGFDLSSASAPQVAQVYSEGAYRLAEGLAGIVLGIALFAIALLMKSGPSVREVICPRCRAVMPQTNYYCGDCGLQFVYDAGEQPAQ